jgi:hypothetical protein
MNSNNSNDYETYIETEFDIELKQIHNKYDDLYSTLICYGGDNYFLIEIGYNVGCKDGEFELDSMEDETKLEYLNYLEKITDLLYVKCNTQEHFINILITLEDYICECPFYNDEMKHNEHIKLMEYRINFMKNI